MAHKVLFAVAGCLLLGVAYFSELPVPGFPPLAAACKLIAAGLACLALANWPTRTEPQPERDKPEMRSWDTRSEVKNVART